MGLFSSVSNFFFDLWIMSWDVLLTLLNLVRRKRRVGHVTPQGHPGYGGYWPEFRAPQEGDSRCSCPALNAMANHGKRSYELAAKGYADVLNVRRCALITHRYHIA
jgi:hypothetical protein